MRNLQRYLLITSKFIWDSFEKFSDELFYQNETKRYSYGQFLQKVIERASQLQSTYSQHEKVSISLDSSLESLVLFFTLLKINAIPVIISKQTLPKQITLLMNSIQDKKILSENKATIIFTSGSSTTPKAILHTFANHYYSALGANANIALQKKDRWLLSLPMHHIGGLSIIFRTLIVGGTLIGYDKTVSIEDTIAQNKVTHVSVVATQLQRMLSYPKKLQSLNMVLVGGGIVPDELIRKALELNLPIYKTYGMSEMTSQVTTTSQGAKLEELFTSGKILDYRELKISEDNEILVKGKVLCRNYLNAKINIDADGWFHTGDLGCVDSNNNLLVLGRKDRMFISGGENIYPEPIEQIILEFENLFEVCIVPKDNKEFGQVPVMFYKTKNSDEVLYIEFKEFLQNKLMPFQIPKEIFLFPKNYKPLDIKPNYKFLIEWLQK